MSDDAFVFEPHSLKQEDALFSDANITVLATGVQWGKTLSGALWLKRFLHTHTNKDDHFLVTAPTYKILKQSTLPHFKKVMEGYGELQTTDMVFTMHNGGLVFFRTNTEPDSVVGIPNIRAIWGDEAGKYSLYFWENIQGRQSTKNCPVMLTTSPYSLNWTWRDVIKPTLEGKRPEVKLIRAPTWENPYNSLHDPAVRDQKRRTMDPRRFDMLFGGEWGKMTGLVYDCWSDTENEVEPFELPKETRYFGAIDWGYTEPFCFKVRAVTPNNDQFGISEFYKGQQTIADIERMLEQKLGVFPIKTVVCGPDQPGHIEHLNRKLSQKYGVSFIAAETPPGSVREGIDAHYELIKTRRYKEFKGTCPYSKDEREVYHYPEPEDLGPDDKAKEQLPVQANDHAMDNDRYMTMYLRGLIKEAVIRAPKSTNPFDAILKRRHSGTQTENW
jgi:hypothetical protein